MAATMTTRSNIYSLNTKIRLFESSPVIKFQLEISVHDPTEYNIDILYTIENKFTLQGVQKINIILQVLEHRNQTTNTKCTILIMRFLVFAYEHRIIEAKRKLLKPSVSILIQTGRN
jgi:hypothetical protein